MNLRMNIHIEYWKQMRWIVDLFFLNKWFICGLLASFWTQSLICDMTLAQAFKSQYLYDASSFLIYLTFSLAVFVSFCFSIAFLNWMESKRRREKKFHHIRWDIMKAIKRILYRIDKIICDEISILFVSFTSLSWNGNEFRLVKEHPTYKTHKHPFLGNRMTKKMKLFHNNSLIESNSKHFDITGRFELIICWNVYDSHWTLAI